MTPAPAPSAPAATLRERVAAFVGSPRIERLIVVLIAINAVTLGLETVPALMAVVGGPLLAIDAMILSVFVLELALKLFAQRAAFWRNPWNVFDTVVIGIALAPEAGPLAVLRALRVLRLLRLISAVPRMRFVVESVIGALPALGSVVMLLLLFFYVFAVMGTKLFGAGFPQWFATLPGSMFSLFQIMTLESWTSIARPIMATYPLAWIYFLSFILVATFMVLNLFIATIVNAMQAQHDAAVAAGREPENPTTHELRLLREEVGALRAALTDRTGRHD